jgi:hypothetical protein
MTTSDDEPTATGGSAGLKGYLYQAKVSAWLALELVVHQRAADALVLEGVSQEDIEAALIDQDTALLDGALRLTFPLHIQVKLRTTTDWDITALASLLTKPRVDGKSAKDNLATPDLRYLLVTNAPLLGKAKGLTVTRPGAFPAADRMPIRLAGKLPKDAAGRVAVLPLIDEERLIERIETRLRTRFKLPENKLRACYDALWSAALVRMERPGGAIWSRAEIEAVITKHLGLPNGVPRGAEFVAPANFDRFVATLNEHHGVIISGTSGTGKTTAAEELLKGLLDSGSGFEVMSITGGPEKVRNHQPADPVVFMIEDPWGRVRADPRAEPWNDAIVGLLAQAGPRRKFIITSRSDVLQAAKPEHLPRAMDVRLESEDYLAEQKAALFEHRRLALPRKLHSSVDGTLPRVLAALDSPSQIDRYFQRLANGRGEKEGLQDYLARCLKEARDGSMDTALLYNIKKVGDERSATLTWGLLKASPLLSTEVAAEVGDLLGDADPAWSDDLADYLAFLLGGRHLRQNQNTLRYEHPLVEEGLRKALTLKPALSRNALSKLLTVLLDGEFGEWGKEGAARLLAVTGFQNIKLKPTSDQRARIDAWLVDLVRAQGAAFEDDLDLAAEAGSPDAPPAVIALARWLRHSWRDWPSAWVEPPGLTEADYERLRDDPDTAALCGAYVRRFLADGRGRYPKEFAAAIARLAPDVASDFVAAAESLVEDSFVSGLDTVLAGARNDFAGLTGLAAKAIAYLDSRKGHGANFHLNDLNGIYGGETANWLAEDYGGDGWAADQILDVYVEVLRNQKGWRGVAAAPRPDMLLRPWIRLLDRDAPDAEVMAVLTAASGGERESDAWNAIGSPWRPAFIQPLATRLAESGLSSDLRRALLDLFDRDQPGLDVQALGRAVGTQIALGRAVELAVDVRLALLPRHGRPQPVCHEANLRLLLQGVAQTVGEAINAVAFEDASLAPAMLTVAAAQLATLSPLGDPVANARIAAVLVRGGRRADDFLDAALTKSPDISKESIAAIAEAVDLAADQGLWRLVEGALKHRFADAIERALVRLADRAPPGVLPRPLRDLADVDYSRVKRRLVAILATRRVPEHQALLIKLTGDEWSDHSPQYEEPTNHPIAQAAADLLAAGPRLTELETVALLKRLDATEDPALAARLLKALLVNAASADAEFVVDMAVAGQNAFLVAAAGKALLMAPTAITPALAGRVTDEAVARMPPRFAANLVEVIGHGAETPQINHVVRTLAAMPDRRALLVCLYLPLRDRDPALAGEVLKHLDDDHLARAIEAAAAGKTGLRRDALHEVGSSQITDMILRRHPSLFRKLGPRKS